MVKRMFGVCRRPEVWVGFVLLVSYQWYWHARDWNSASRLMLTYAVVDRGTVSINGYEDQTHDRAKVGDHYYSEKFPGFSAWAIVPYALSKWISGIGDHPVGAKGFAYWPTDYWVTLGTSGLATALMGSLLAWFAQVLGCSPRQSAWIALAYGLGTPAYVYATMSYGHQLAAASALAGLALLWGGSRLTVVAALGAGACAAFVSVVELQAAPLSAALGIAALGMGLGGRASGRAVLAFCLGVLGPTALLLGYNTWAFGAPFDLGYFHLDNQFKAVHTANNPLGVRGPDWSIAARLLWGEYRGLVFYAPIVLLAVPGWVVLAVRRRWGLALTTLVGALGMFLINLSYPEWTGGWSTGPRILLPALPWVVVAAAAFVGASGRLGTALVVASFLWGFVLISLFQAVGGHVIQDETAPLTGVVWPVWAGDPLPAWWTGERFVRTSIDGWFPQPLAWERFPVIWAVQAALIIAGLALTPKSSREGGAS